MDYLNFIVICTIISMATALNIGLNKDAEGRDFRFYNYNNQFCMQSANGNEIVVAFDCSDPTAIFTLNATPTSIDDGFLEYEFTAIKFTHKSSGKYLGHNDAGVLGLYDCETCCNSAKYQEWLQHNTWNSYFMINSNGVWDNCIAAEEGLGSLDTPIFTKKCVYSDNSQWWALWQV